VEIWESRLSATERLMEIIWQRSGVRGFMGPVDWLIG